MRPDDPHPPGNRDRFAAAAILGLLLLAGLGMATRWMEGSGHAADTPAWANLTVRTLGPMERDGAPVIILLHGFGTDENDLVPLARSLDVGADVRFVLPGAPRVREGGGRAWWPLDLEAVRRARARDDTWMRAVPEGLPEARAQMLALLRDVQARLGTKPEQIVIGGFSQGAMLAMDVALHAPTKLAAVASLSGASIAEPVWQPKLRGKRDMHALLSHGRQDPLIPFEASLRLRTKLEDAGLRVTWVPFEGGHSIPRGVRDRLGQFLRDALVP